MPAKHRSESGSSAAEPKIKLDQWLPQLLDHFMSAWNEELGKQLKRVGLTFPQWRILLMTSQRGSMNIRQLSDATLVPHSTLARWIRYMEKTGLVSSNTLGEDKRAVEVSITSKGRRAFARAYPIAQKVYREALVGFSEIERKALIDFLYRLRSNIGMS